jgi:hypothetical protein
MEQADSPLVDPKEQKYINICADIGQKTRVIRALENQVKALHAEADAVANQILEKKKEENNG